MANRKIKIANKHEYNAALKEVDLLMKKGESKLKPPELQKLRTIAEAVEEYEETYLPLPKAETIQEMIELKMFELKINQAQLAGILELGTPKLSQILNGKRDPDIAFLKAVHQKLHVDANFLLEKV